MKAILCKTLDGPESLVLEDIAAPVAGPGEVVIRVKAAALNFFDTLITRGKYQKKPQMPFSPSGEVSGVVDQIGDGVIGLTVGQRVTAYVAFGGAREKVAVSADAVIPTPDNVSDILASGVSVTYGTAIHGLKDRARVQANEWVAVTGASGGAGLAAIEIAKLLGARVIAVASSAEKLEICRQHGADVLVNYSDGDLKEKLKSVTGGNGVDVIYDCVGGEYAEPAVRALAWEGRFLVVGFAAGEIPKLPLNLLLVKGAAAIGVFWGESVKRDPKGHRDNMTAVLNWVSEGKLVPHTHATFPLAEAANAIAVLDRREAVGKVVLTV